MAMTGGTAKLVHTGYGGGSSSFPIKVYVYYKTSTNSSTLKSTITCGMYVTTPSGWDIGSWYDSGGSYVGTKSLTFDGEIPNFDGTRWLVENKSFTVSHNATTGTATATIYWKWGVNSSWGQCVYPQGSFTITLPKIITACSAPTTFTATSDVSGKPFETKVALAWSGAKAGTANTISKYEIQYRVYTNSAWGSWTALGTTTSTSSNADMSSKVSRGAKVQFRIRTQGSAGSSYYSAWKNSGELQRQSYTKCIAPTAFTITDINPQSTSKFEITLSWSGASGGTSNTIASYYIWYATSSNNSTWESWKEASSVTSTSTSGTKSFDMSETVGRGQYIKFRIQVRGSAGSSYYSDYVETSSIQRNPYTNCTAPTYVTISSDVLSNPFDNQITIVWSEAKSGTNNAIASYLIRYSTSDDNATWSSYTDLITITSTATSGSYTIDVSSKVTRGHYIKIAIRTQGSAGSNYYSDYMYSTTLQRNPYTKCIAPAQITLTSEKSLNGNTFTDVFENSITMSFSDAKAGENNTIVGYSIQYRGSNDKTNWDSWKIYNTYESTETSRSYEISNIADVARGNYIQFRIATLSSQSGYDSDYAETPIMRKNSIPLNTSCVSTNLSELEYSYGDDIVISWSQPSDIDNNIYKYQVMAYTNVDGVFTNILDTEVVGENNLTFTLNKDNKAYKSIKNNHQLKFAVRPIDVFGVSAETYQESSVITRYDDTGVYIGIDGKWIPCQFYVCTNGQWVEQSVGAGVNNNWLQCGIE